MTSYLGRSREMLAAAKREQREKWYGRAAAVIGGALLVGIGYLSSPLSCRQLADRIFLNEAAKKVELINGPQRYGVDPDTLRFDEIIQAMPELKKRGYLQDNRLQIGDKSLFVLEREGPREMDNARLYRGRALVRLNADGRPVDLNGDEEGYDRWIDLGERWTIKRLLEEAGKE